MRGEDPVRREATPGASSTEGKIGEIYVIGVDPAFQGLGLGSELTLAGLESLHDRGALEGMLYVDGDNRRPRRCTGGSGSRSPAATAPIAPQSNPRSPHADDDDGPRSRTPTTSLDELPRWSVADLHESLESRSFLASMEQAGADVERIVVSFDRLGIRAIDPRVPTADDGRAADEAITAYNDVADQFELLEAYVYATVSTDSFNEQAQALLSQLEQMMAGLRPLVARLADWVHALHEGGSGPTRWRRSAKPPASTVDRCCASPPVRRTRCRSWRRALRPARHRRLVGLGRLQSDVTSQLTAEVSFPDGTTERLPMPAVRGLATHGDPLVRRRRTPPSAKRGLGLPSRAPPR